jgi:hypothetical protein
LNGPLSHPKFDPDQEDPASSLPHLPPPPKPAKRKRGGQPGNRNALKHGFYARSFDLDIIKDLDIHSPHVDDEIHLLRLFMRRICQNAFVGGGQTDLQTLRALALASNIVARLYKTRNAFDPSLASILSASLEEAIASPTDHDRLETISNGLPTPHEPRTNHEPF